jgi:hypothetical protein
LALLSTSVGVSHAASVLHGAAEPSRQSAGISGKIMNVTTQAAQLDAIAQIIVL